MKIEPILAETYRIKDMLASEAGYSIRRLCQRIETSMTRCQGSSHQVHSAEELASLVAREAPERLAAIPAESLETYRMHDPIIAEIHRTRARLSHAHNLSDFALRDEPPRSKP